MSFLKKILFLAGTLVAVGASAGYFWHWHLRAAVDSYVAELKAKGEPMDLEQILPPPIPPEENGADALREAARLLGPSNGGRNPHPVTNLADGMIQVGPGKALILWQQPRIINSEGDYSWEDVGTAIDQNAAAFELLLRIIDKPRFSFPIQYDQGIANLRFPDYCPVESRTSAFRLGTAVICALHRGNTAAAVKCLRAMLAIVKAMRAERLVISELVRIAIAQSSVSVTWEVLQTPGLTDAQLAELQRDWAEAEFIAGWEGALTVERACGRISVRNWRSSQETALRALGLGGQSSIVSPGLDAIEDLWRRMTAGLNVFRWRHWWSYADELRSLKGGQALLETLRRAGTNSCFRVALEELEMRLTALGIGHPIDSLSSFPARELDLHSMLSHSVATLSVATRRLMTVEAAKQIVMTAIALRRYELKNGKYPPGLESLVPEFLAKVPLDPVDGHPLRYRPNSDGKFLLYSVGTNGVDDGGNPSPKDIAHDSSIWWLKENVLDWVWPQPAPKKQIEDYLKKKATRRRGEGNEGGLEVGPMAFFGRR